MAKKTKTNPVSIVAVLDRSGSMGSIVNDAIGGFNTFLAEQQALPDPADMTVVLFDDKYEVLYDSIPLSDVKPLTTQTFVPRGMTAMNDAICRSLTSLEIKNPKKAIVCILTDGEENNSREFTTEQTKEKIKAAEARGWEVLYLGANQDAFAVGASYGVAAGNSMAFAATGAGVKSAYDHTSIRTTSYRTAH